jgi:hypothetical protein
MRGGSHLSTTHGGTSLTWLAPMHARSSSLLLLPTALRRLHLHIGNTSSWFVLINQTWWIKRTRTPKANVGEPKIQGTRPRADDDAKWTRTSATRDTPRVHDEPRLCVPRLSFGAVQLTLYALSVYSIRAKSQGQNRPWRSGRRATPAGPRRHASAAESPIVCCDRSHRHQKLDKTSPSAKRKRTPIDGCSSISLLYSTTDRRALHCTAPRTATEPTTATDLFLSSSAGAARSRASCEHGRELMEGHT